jgi:hypothetical protein
MQLDLLDFAAAGLAVVVVVFALVFIVTIWAGALGSPLF